VYLPLIFHVNPDNGSIPLKSVFGECSQKYLWNKKVILFLFFLLIGTFEIHGQANAVNSEDKIEGYSHIIIISATCILFLFIVSLLTFRVLLKRSKRKLEIKAAKSDIVNIIYRSILSAESFEDSIYFTIREFKSHFSFTRVSITFFDFENGTFIPYGIADKQKVSALKNGTAFPIEQFGSLSVLKQHKTCLVQDVMKKESISVSDKEMMAHENIRSYFLCPLIGKGELIGSLNFSSDLVDAFSEQMISFCEEIANGIAISLNQYNLQEKIKTINSTLEKKEKDITDSINYAKRIQQAKLPSPDHISSCLPSCFVLYKPKDIVSGDFYFFRKIKGLIFIACADCTGHGVPGALMSMMCSEMLDETISQTTDTSQILNQLNKKIKNSLQQSDNYESSRDGMDIALCSIDIANRIIKYAGANRPLWVIRAGQKTVEEVKGNKKAIGGFTNEDQVFETQWIKLKEGDAFYLSTDGYADIFGGKRKKKLMTKRFKELLIKIQDLTMEKQKQYLDDFIEEWKGDTEQVDDILVIGGRL
jgi:serine phosphatase RsbU (regulator of sigma subunit)